MAHLEDRDVVMFSCQEDGTLPILVHNVNGSSSLKESAKGIGLSVGNSRKEGSVGVTVQSINTRPSV